MWTHWLFVCYVSGLQILQYNGADQTLDSTVWMAKTVHKEFPSQPQEFQSH